MICLDRRVVLRMFSVEIELWCRGKERGTRHSNISTLSRHVRTTIKLLGLHVGGNFSVTNRIIFSTILTLVVTHSVC
jgi:hypothetical protein